MSVRAFASPGKFYIGKGILNDFYRYINQFGSSCLIIAHQDDLNRVSFAIEKLKEKKLVVHCVSFFGECTDNEITRIRAIAKSNNVQIVIGLGGGKAIDTAKAVAHFENKVMIAVPTIASTDAPCSTLAVVYNEDHTFDKCYFFPKNPDIVIADSDIIAKAPVKFLIAGIGDAYATYFEAKSCIQSNAQNFVGGISTLAAYEMAKLCNRILIEDAFKAVQSCKENAVTMALENIIEANLLLSGIGFESSGLSAAHAFYNAVTILPQTHKVMHGNLVAIGVLFQHILENESEQQIKNTIDFFKKVGLPTTYAEIGIENNLAESLRSVADVMIEKGPSISNLNFDVTADSIYDSLCMVEALSTLLK